jgi:hypothetical protein
VKVVKCWNPEPVLYKNEYLTILKQLSKIYILFSSSPPPSLPPHPHSRTDIFPTRCRYEEPLFTALREMDDPKVITVEDGNEPTLFTTA